MADLDRRDDLKSILFSESRDYLVRNNEDKIKADGITGKTLGLYFSASWCGPCHRFTPNLVGVYNDLKPNNKFEIVFVSADHSIETFNAYFSDMPWLAIPFTDTQARQKLDELFGVEGIPFLVILDENSEVLTTEGVEVVSEYGAAGFPFSSEQIAKLKELEEEARRNQSLKSLLVSESRDYVVTADDRKVPVAELEGKTLCLYFVVVGYDGSVALTSKLIEMYRTLKEQGEDFEIVMIPLDKDEQLFKEGFKHMPWFSLPVKDPICSKLARYFELRTIMTVVAIGPDGKTLHPNVADAIEEHGANAYPFTPEKFAELEEIEKAKRESQTLESLLVSQDCDSVIGKDDVKIPVSDLVGKHILLYFSAHWCPPCRAFMPTLVKAYEEINKNDSVLEVIFISSDRDQASFNDYYSKMPWLALPFGDGRKSSLSRMFNVRGIPTLVAIGADGKTVSTEARELIQCHGAGAFPFTAERLKELEAAIEKMAEGWPKKLNYASHEHELELTKRKSFICDGCDEQGQVWSFYCKDCDFDLHPKCALKEEGKKGEDEDKGSGEERV